MTNQSLIRDIKLGVTTGDYKVTIDTNRLPGYFYYFFNKKRRIVKDLLDRGIILTGSRALNCYKLNGKPLLNREPNDWDFVISKDQLLEICRDYKIYDFDLNKTQYLLNRAFATFSDGYSGPDSHWFPCFIQLIIKDELQPSSQLENGWKIATLESIIESKMELANPIFVNQRVDPKHQHDLNNIIVNTHSR